MVSFRWYRWVLILTCVWSFSFIQTARAQNKAYDELHQSLGQLSNEQAFNRLFRYQSGNQQFANTYIQLGHYAELISKELDPLRDFREMGFWLKSATLYYELFGVYLENNEVRRNRDLYSNLPVESSGRRLTHEDVLAYTQERIQWCTNYADSLQLIYSSLEIAKDHYNNCVKIFNTINEEYDHLKDALLQTDQKLLSMINKLEREYVSCRDEFYHYKHLLSKFPLKSYHQTMHTKTISTFRLDGLTNSDFLMDTFYVWDYSGWIKHFMSTFESEILALRQEVAITYSKYINNQTLLEQQCVVDQNLILPVHDQFFLFRLGKYDNNSLVRDLFDYLKERQQYLLLSKNAINSSDDSTSFQITRKMRFYYRLGLQLNQSKRSLDALYSQITQQKVSRFADFFNSQFQGMEGLSDFYKAESVFLDQTFDLSLDRLQQFLMDNTSKRMQAGYAMHHSHGKIPLYYTHKDLENDSTSAWITKTVLYQDDLPSFVGGRVYDGGNSRAFIAKVLEGNLIDWVSYPGVAITAPVDTTECVSQLHAYENGLVALMTSRLAHPSDTCDMTDVVNPVKFVHLDQSGNVLHAAFPEYAGWPVHLHYDEINALCRIVYGVGEQLASNSFGSFVVCLTDSAGTVLSRSLIDEPGQFVNFFLLEGKYIAIISTHPDAFADQGGNKPSGISIVDISPDGTLQGVQNIKLADNLLIDRALMLSSDEICLLGRKLSDKGSEAGLVFLVLSPWAEVLFSSYTGLLP